MSVNKSFSVIALFSIFLCGCSVVTRPPSAAAFMSSYNSEKTIDAISVGIYSGDLVRDYKKVDYLPKPNDEISSHEWPADVSYTHFFNKSHFSMGLGIQTMTLFIQPGFVSRNFGLMGWSNFPLGNIDAGRGEIELGWMGGVSAIQQLVFNDVFKIGLTEHVSRNGRESVWNESDCITEGFGPTGACMGDRMPITYLEIGVGAYIAIGHFSFEFRYGRDLSEKKDRFTIAVDLMFFSRKKLD